MHAALSESDSGTRNVRLAGGRGNTLSAAAWVYVQSEPRLWTVGFFDPSGKWHTDSDHDAQEKAAKRTAWLNGAAR